MFQEVWHLGETLDQVCLGLEGQYLLDIAALVHEDHKIDEAGYQKNESHGHHEGCVTTEERVT